MKNFKIIFFLLATIYSLLTTFSFAQVDTAWVRRYNGPGDRSDEAYAIAVDLSGNVYVTGQSFGSGTSTDYATIKYNSAGVQEWVQRYNGPQNGSDFAYAIALDDSGNVYVTGYSYGLGTVFDYATIKYNSAGVQEWVQRYNGPGNSNDFTYAIAVDDSGNVYVTGGSPGSVTGYDYATIKYNLAGVEQWVQRYNGPGNRSDQADAIAVDGSGNVYVTGYSASDSVSPYNNDYATIKYNSAGVQQWVARYNGPANNYDDANAITVDNTGNVYVTGCSGSGNDLDYATIKYNSAGVQGWVQRYAGPGNNRDEAFAIAVDNSGNVYVTGGSRSGSGTEDYATIKYNSGGVEQWVQRYNGPGNNIDIAYGLVVDGQSNIYVTGYSYGSVTGYDYATIKYNSAGVQEWVQRYNGPANGNDRAYAIVVDGSVNVYVTGGIYISGTFSDYATIKYVQTEGIEENEIASLPLAMTSGFEVCPNPASSVIRVRVPQTLRQAQGDNCMLKMFDVSGKMIKEIRDCFATARNDGLVRVSLKGMSPGIYFLQLGNEHTIKKVVITK